MPNVVRAWLAAVCAALLLAATSPAGATTYDEPPGTLTGLVVAASGPVPGAPVQVVDAPTGTPAGWTSTDPDGRWRVAVPAGTYTVSTSRYPLVVYAPGTTEPSRAGQYDVRPGEETHADIAVPPPTTVTGRVSDAATGHPLDGVCVTLHEPGDPYGQWGGHACSGPDGSYVVETSAGTWVAVFDDPTGVYGTAWSGGAVRVGEAAAFTVTEGEQTSGVDAALQPGATVTGRAVLGAERTAVAEACAYAVDALTDDPIEGQDGATCSGPDGVFEIRGLPAVPVKVHVSTPDGARAWAPKAATQEKAKAYRTEAGSTTRLGDVRLKETGVVQGTVTDAVTGEPLADMTVELNGYAPRAGGTVSEFATVTDAEGRYSIAGVPAGEWLPVAYDEQGAYAVQWGGDATSPADADPAKVRAGRTSTVDFALETGAVVTGVLAEPDGAPVGRYVVVDAWTTDGEQHLGYSTDVSAEDGTFTIRGLPATEVVLRFDEWSPDGQDVFWHDAATTLEQATRLSLAPGQTVAVTSRRP